MKFSDFTGTRLPKPNYYFYSSLNNNSNIWRSAKCKFFITLLQHRFPLVPFKTNQKTQQQTPKHVISLGCHKRAYDCTCHTDKRIWKKWNIYTITLIKSGQTFSTRDHIKWPSHCFKLPFLLQALHSFHPVNCVMKWKWLSHRSLVALVRNY